MNQETEQLLQKHAGHTITIWENNEWNVQLDGRGETLAADFGTNGGFDTETPLYCHDCREEIAWNSDYIQLVREAVEHKYDSM